MDAEEKNRTPDQPLGASPVLPQDDDDRIIVQRCLNGDRAAFAGLVARYSTPIFNTAYRMTRDDDDAADISQTVFVKAYENLATFDHRYRFFSWLYRICINESLTHVTRRTRTTPLDDDVADDDAHAADRRLERDMLDHEVRRAMLTLTDDQRIVLVLRHYRDLTYAEIAAELGIPEITVKSRLFTARRALRDILLSRGVLP